MKLNLKKPLVVFDLETTGLDMVKDRIIQMSYIKVMPDGSESRKNLYVNPGMPIPEEVVALTGISDEDVKNAPTFKQLAANLQKEFEGCDFAGYNSNRFDVPMLAEEFLRAGIDFDFSKCRLIDAQTIFMKMERRNLAAAYKFYCGRKMEEDFEAHRADQLCMPLCYTGYMTRWASDSTPTVGRDTRPRLPNIARLPSPTWNCSAKPRREILNR